MHRFQKLEEKINKGVTIFERNKSANSAVEQVKEWSPNNFRRLIIGYDWAAIQHFVVSGRSPKLVEEVDLRVEANKDMQLLESNPQKYKSILSAVLTGRVLSSVEEIVFCKKGYPDHMFALDADLKILAQSESGVESRFPRLRHVSFVPSTVEEVWSFLGLSKKPDVLLLDTLKAHGKSVTILTEQNIDTWWSGSSLRPRYYLMDSGKLSDYFTDLRDSMLAKKKQEESSKILDKQVAETLKSRVPALSGILTVSFEMLDNAHSIFTNAPVISKSEWANTLLRTNVIKQLRAELTNVPTLVTSLRRVCFDKLLKGLSDNEYDQKVCSTIANFQDIIFATISEEEYKRESNKDSLTVSMETLKKVASIFFGVIVNSVYLALVRYLSRNGAKHAGFFFKKLQPEVESFCYTVNTMAFLNKNLEDGLAKKVFDKVGGLLIPSEQFSVQLRYQESIKILQGLLKTVR